MHEYIRLRSGRRFSFKKPGPTQFTVVDLVWGLSRMPRFLGQTDGAPYTIGQHLCLCHDLAPDHCKREALVHDMQEALCSDIVSPCKALLPDYRDVELRIERMLARRFGWRYPFPPDVKRVDLVALATEMRDLTRRRDWNELPYPPANVRIVPWPEDVVRTEFMKRWKIYHR
jgi:hypothetical protein